MMLPARGAVSPKAFANPPRIAVSGIERVQQAAIRNRGDLGGFFSARDLAKAVYEAMHRAAICPSNEGIE